MSLNTNISNLDSGQIANRVYDPTTDAIRIDLSSSLGTEIEVNSADGDSILVVGTTDGTTSGTQKVLKVDSGGVLQAAVSQAGSWTMSTTGSLITVAWDYVAATYPSGTQEVYTYKTGGSGGSTVATITINYTDSTKASILNLART